MSGPHSTMDASFATTSSAYHHRPNRIISNHNDRRRPRGGGGGGDDDSSSRPRRRRRHPHPALTALVIPCCLLLASSSSSSSPAHHYGGCHGLSTVVLPAATRTMTKTTTTKTFPRTSSSSSSSAAGGTTTSSSPPSRSSSSSSSVRRPGIVRVLRKDGIGSGRKSKPASDHYRRRYDADADADALVAALFDDDFSSSLEIAIAGLGGRSTSSSSVAGAATTTTDGKERAEENDRLAEEDAILASEVRRNLAGGGLVDEARRGADVDVDFAEILRREAADRRGGRLPMGEGSASVVGVDANNANASAGPHVEVVRRSERSPPARGVIRRRTAKTSSGGDDDYGNEVGGARRPLLTREREYALARTIRSGARLHNLRAEYELTHSSGGPISKREWAKLAGLTPNDLRKLISDYRTAKEELVSRNVGLVRAVVRSQYARRAEHRGVPIEELIQEGSLGLIRAAELFDPSRGLRFSTYATIWIKGVLSNSNSLDEVISLPSREKAIHNKVRRAWEDMAIETGDGDGASRGGGKRPSASSAEELAVRLGMEKSSVEEHLRRMACVTNVLSLDYRYSSSTRSGHSSGDMDEALRSCSSFGTDADLAERAQFRADVVSGLVKNLTERELTLMRLRYGLEDGTEHTVKECAARMGINKETARLLQHACLKKLREASNMESLQEYLLTVA